MQEYYMLFSYQTWYILCDIPGLGSIFPDQSKMDNPEKLATQATQNEEDMNNKYATQYALDTTIRKENTNNVNSA